MKKVILHLIGAFLFTAVVMTIGNMAEQAIRTGHDAYVAQYGEYLPAPASGSPDGAEAILAVKQWLARERPDLLAYHLEDVRARCDGIRRLCVVNGTFREAGDSDSGGILPWRAEVRPETGWVTFRLPDPIGNPGGAQANFPPVP